MENEAYFFIAKLKDFFYKRDQLKEFFHKRDRLKEKRIEVYDRKNERKINYGTWVHVPNKRV